MKLKDRIDALAELGDELRRRPQWLEEQVERAFHVNRWFSVHQSWQAIEAIATHFLDKEKLKQWTDQYTVAAKKDVKQIGMVLAGNIPMVGFHDVLCCFVSGHRSLVKLSSKDEVLMQAVFGYLFESHPEIKAYIEFTDKLKGFDAVIATGSNNTSRYFEDYFGKYPNIIRKNRNAVAVLNGEEEDQDFINLGVDIFNYYGLGCRNVSKMYVPKDYKFDDMLRVLHDHYKHLANHNKYRNNFDYNNALFMLNKVPFLMNGSLILTESKNIASRIATVHYSHYTTQKELEQELQNRKEEIQCIVSKNPLGGLQTFDFGQAQKPTLNDYADGVDTMAFLNSI